MDIAVRADRAAKRGVDPVVAQVHMDAARWANCRGRSRVELLRGTAVETSHRGDAWPARPYVLEAAQKILRRHNTTCDFQRRLRRFSRACNRKMLAALAAQRVLGRGILRLLKATVRTLHTELRRRLGHKLEALRVRNDPQTRAWPRRARRHCAISPGGNRYLSWVSLSYRWSLRIYR